MAELDLLVQTDDQVLLQGQREVAQDKLRGSFLESYLGKCPWVKSNLLSIHCISGCKLLCCKLSQALL